MKSPNLKQAVKLALFAGLAASMSTPVLAQDEDGEDAAQLDRVVVTGSRISRVQLEGATPVVTIDREEIEATGFASIADVLRNTSFNSFGSLRENSGNTAQSQALLSLRGIGSNRTLVLLNGRRLPGSPVLDNQVQNLNAIPFAAVERIEILSDGASAIYGSDAIGGVVNIILRDDFEGVEATIRYAQSTRENPWERMVSVVGGITGAKGNVTFTMEKDFKSIIFARDRFYTASEDFNAPGQFDFANTTGYSVFSRNVFNGGFFAGMLQGNPGDPGCGVYGDGFVDEHFSYYYGYYSICAWDFTKIAAQTADLDRMSMFLNADYEINDDLTFWARAGHNRVESFGRYAPAAGAFLWAGPALPATPYTAPDGTVYTLTPINPGDFIAFRFNNTGPGRDTTQYNYVSNLQGGLKGYTNGMQWEFGVEYNQYDMHEWGDGYVNVLGLDAAANLGWDPRQPDQSQFTAAVPSMRENANRRALSTYQKVDFGLQFDGPELGAGPTAFFVGGEYREETYKDQTQAQAEAGNVIGSAGGSAEGARDSSGIFAEVSLPLTDTFELNAALRGDNYSDFGSETTGKLSFRFQPMDAFVLRGSYGTGFRAPSLSTLFAAPAQSFEFSVDITACTNAGNTLEDCVARSPQQFETFFISNPNLGAETSNQYLLGGVFDMAEIGGPALTFSLDYYYIEIENVITGIGAQDAFFLEFLGLLGPGTPFDGIVSVDRSGATPVITARSINFESFDTTGIDFRVGYAVGLGDLGNLDLDLNLSKVLEFNQRFFLISELQDFSGFPGAPDTRWDMNITWTYGDFAVNLQTYSIAGMDGENIILAPAPNPGLIAVPTGPDLDSFMAHNLSVRWMAPWDADIAVGMNNLTDEDPVLDSSLGFDSNLYPLDGRMTFVSYTQRF